MSAQHVEFTWRDTSGRDRRWSTAEVLHLEFASGAVKITRRVIDSALTMTVILDGEEAAAFLESYNRAIGLPTFGKK